MEGGRVTLNVPAIVAAGVAAVNATAAAEWPGNSAMAVACRTVVRASAARLAELATGAAEPPTACEKHYACALARSDVECILAAIPRAPTLDELTELRRDVFCPYDPRLEPCPPMIVVDMLTLAQEVHVRAAHAAAAAALAELAAAQSAPVKTEHAAPVKAEQPAPVKAEPQ